VAVHVFALMHIRAPSGANEPPASTASQSRQTKNTQKVPKNCTKSATGMYKQRHNIEQSTTVPGIPLDFDQLQKQILNLLCQLQFHYIHQ
jgi:hypothetical protein